MRAIESALRLAPVAGIVPTIEWRFRSRLVASGLLVGTQVLLYVVLWRALYADVDTVAGLRVEQAVSYSVLATLIGTTRVLTGGMTSESMPSRLRDGSILFWFTRPLSPRRYCFWRGLGEALYCAAWLVAGVAIAAACGVVSAPPGGRVAAVFALSFLLGQALLYYLGQLIELAAFWTVTTYSVTRLYTFAYVLLSGALIPVWFFPDWLRIASGWLPFAAAINTPVSIYVGRLAAGWGPLAVQALWCVVLAGLARLVWRRAARRLQVFGG
ncbi:MAG: ABC-2 family transporter protein [Sporichthyaceae bacterium]|nr:ABC-2 family transporter protein [Sporichthyaceae bacterium]